jgi:uncharacterized caspase-like protein
MWSSRYRLYFALGLFFLGLGINALYANTHSERIALVIGNTEYTQLPRLKNASNDALLIARALSDKGFTVFSAKDVTSGELRKTLDFVANRAKNADQIIIYYAGHNEIRNGVTQILPIESMGSLGPPDPSALSIPDLLGYFNFPFAQKAVILDTCLLTPPGTIFADEQTLSLPKALGLETLLVFATSFGQSAYDGTGQHSVFTGALLDYMAKETFDLQSTIQSVRRDVIQTSQTNQTPVSISTLTQPFVLGATGSKREPAQIQNTLIQSYSNSGFAEKPLLNTISVGINPEGF